MKRKPNNSVAAAELRHRAETRLRDQRNGRPAGAGVPKSAADHQRQLHELEVHQIELEMQNAELKDTRNRIEELLENYTDLYDFAPVGYFTIAASGIIRQANLTGAQLVGIERSRLVGQSFGGLIATGFRPLFAAFLKQVYAGQTKQSAEFELVRPGQSPRFVNLEAQCLLNGQECRVAMMDITERKQQEDKLRVSEIRYRRLFETAHDGVLVLDPGTRKITDANPFMTKLLGYPHDQLVGKELFEIGLLKDEVASQEMFQKLKRQHEVRYEDLPLESQAGRHQEVEVVANLYQEDGHAVIQCNIRDITERKKAEIHALRLVAIVESSDDAIIGMDMKGHVTEWNKGAEKIFGFSAGEMLGQSINRLIPTDRPGEEEKILSKIRRGLSVEHFETQRLTKAGRLIEVSVTASPIRQKNGRIIGVSKVARDTTQQRQAEAARRRAEVLATSNLKLKNEIARRWVLQTALKQSYQHQEQLLTRSQIMQEELRQLSHQMLTAQEDERLEISRELHDVVAQTLTGINVRLAALAKAATVNPKYLNRDIASTQRRVEKSVDIVHRFARELRPAVLDDLGLIPALHTFVKNFSARTHVQIQLQAFAGVEQLDIVKRTVLFRVAQEALTNVARHAQAGRVEIKLLKRPAAVGLTIHDNGKSFAVERTLSANAGKRLGLVGMRERVEMVGGTFRIESTPGHGTTVQVEMPAAKTRGGGAGKVR